MQLHSSQLQWPIQDPLIHNDVSFAHNYETFVFSLLSESVEFCTFSSG